MKIRVAVVDDMSLARQRLIRHLAKQSDVEIVAECADGESAVQVLRKKLVDVVFLDVQMPEIDGFDVIAAIGPENMPAVIFLTAYNEYAVRAFEVSAVDYLLKPFDEARLCAALDKVRERISRPYDEVERLRTVLQKLGGKANKRFSIRTSGKTVLIDADDIDWIEAAGNYLVVHVDKERHTMRGTMAELEARLDPERFVRIHRSTMVNIDRIKELQPQRNGDQVVLLNDGTELTLSRTYREQVEVLLNN